MPIKGNGMKVDPVTAAVTAAVEKVAPPKPTTEVVFDPDAPRDELERQLLAMRDPPVVEVKPPPAPTPRQRKQTEIEQAAGRKRVAHFEKLDANRPQRAPSPKDGSMTPVMRSAEYVHEKNTNKATTV